MVCFSTGQYKEEKYMTRTSDAVNRDFKMWMSMTLGLIKDGKMGVSRARAERIKTALAYAKKGN